MTPWLSVRGIRIMLLVAVGIDLAYWLAWFTQRTLVASDTTAAYYQFENAFPLADAWLALACLLAWWALGHGSQLAFLWLVAAGGAGLYLFGMDVLYDLEHGTYGRGGGGVIEAAINLVTLAFSVIALRWAWTMRRELLDGDLTMKEAGR